MDAERKRIIDNMIDAMQIGGTCVLLGTVGGALHIDNYMNRVVYRELIVKWYNDRIHQAGSRWSAI
jgi:threonine dehydrogenase-like Zn-dependent dehydrogenase